MTQLRRWTVEEWESAKVLRRQGLSHLQIADQLGFNKEQVRLRFKKFKAGMHDGLVVREPVDNGPVPQRTLDDRDHRRELSHRDLTAEFCGDPLPGYSALERR